MRRGRRKLIAVRSWSAGWSATARRVRVMADEGIEVRHDGVVPLARGRPLQLRPDLPRERLERARAPAPAQVLPVPGGRQGLAPGRRGAVRRGELRATPAPVLDDAITQLLAAMDAGTFRTRGRRPFKPSTRRASNRPTASASPTATAVTVSTRLDHLELQEFIDELDAAGTNPSTIEGTVLPLRLVFRWARARGIVGRRPDRRPRAPREVVPPASPAVPAATRPRSSPPSRTPTAPSGPPRCWPASAEASSSPSTGRTSTSSAGVLHVKRSYDPTSGTFGRPKSKHGIRTIPITAALTPYLARPRPPLRPPHRPRLRRDSRPARSTPAASRTAPTRPGWPSA